jgi:protein-arginine kinase activator protein McsA
MSVPSSPDMPQMHCSSCHKDKDIVFFYKDPTKIAGRKTVCNFCTSEQKRQRRAKFHHADMPFQSLLSV